MDETQVWQVPRRRDAASFWIRTRLLSAFDLLRELLKPHSRRWSVGARLAQAPVVAEVRSSLWTEGRAEEFILVAGKVQNLRVAVRALDGVEVAAGHSLSFWRQVGRPSAGRGFVTGREVREGCVVPSLAGGICQLSNALATAASRAGLQLVERHGHSARVQMPTASDSDAIDATVFWRHIDLRVQGQQDWRIEAELTAHELVVRIRSAAPSKQRSLVLQPLLPMERRTDPPVARGCLSCGETQCFRHREHAHAVNQRAKTAALLDMWTPEFEQFLLAEAADRFVPTPMRLAFWRGTGQAWTGPEFHCARWTSVRRALWQRLWARHAGGRRQASIVDGQRWLARAYAARLEPLHTRVIVEQGLLPHLEKLGALAGREVIVLAHSLPIASIQARLDAAAARWPGEASLRDYRAPLSLVTAEHRALRRADRLVTAHAEVAVESRALGSMRIDVLPWLAPEQQQRAVKCDELPLFVFPASAVARKGWLELAAALADLPPFRLRIVGRPVTEAQLPGLQLEVAEPGRDPLEDADAVVLPAHVEHSPRLLLKAIGRGIPVVATRACGLGALNGWTEVSAGDVPALVTALKAVLKPPASAPRCRPRSARD